MKEMQKNPDMEHDDPNAKRLKPKATGEIVWQFTKAGTFDFSCLIPGHREAGMFGTIVVESTEGDSHAQDTYCGRRWQWPSPSVPPSPPVTIPVAR